jgi:hypothetical protein
MRKQYAQDENAAMPIAIAAADNFMHLKKTEA